MAPAVIAIGASLGGIEAIEVVLRRLPRKCPPVVVAQHIPAGFSRAFARRLNETCRLAVKEAEHGDLLLPGRVFIAPGDLHMTVRRNGGACRVALNCGPPVCYQRPSIDVLFASVAEAAGAAAIGVLLTGMGADGAQGLLRMKRAGALTIAQDEATSVVFGMPKQAIRLGAVDRVISLHGIPAAILAAIRTAPRAQLRPKLY